MKFIYENFSGDIFPGFCETTLYNSGMFDYCKCPDGFYKDFKAEEFQNYQIETCKDWVSEMAKQIKGNPIGLKILGYAGMSSPREYNFRTDRISVLINVNLSKLKKICFTDNSAEFNKYLADNWTSYSGFISFIPNNLYRFKDKYINRPNSRDELTQIMIEWYLLKFIDFDEITMDMYDSQYERLEGKLALIKDEDSSEWNYEYSDETDMYIPTEKIA